MVAQRDIAWGGQLQRWQTGQFKAENPESPTAFIPADDEPALLPYVAKMSEDLLEFDEKPIAIQILDENGDLLLAGVDVDVDVDVDVMWMWMWMWM